VGRSFRGGEQVDREGTVQEKGKDKVSGVRCLFGDGAGRATGWA
jgi:hypothetical protein